MPARILLRSGYDFARRFTLYLDGVPEDLSAATIEASLKNEDKSAELITDTAQSNVGDADWANGDVVVRFAAADSAALEPQRAWIELAVVISGVRLPYEDIPVVIEKGYTL
jgi:hypothetical protein